MDRTKATWIPAYLYLAFLFLGAVPALAGSPLFAIQLESVLLVLVYLFSSYITWGASKATKYLVGTWLASYVIELIGVSTGYPFGNYSYTSAMSPFLGPVPISIPFLWCALGYFCLRAGGPSVVVPALLLVFLDVSFDPIFSRSLWHWIPPLGLEYSGVPVLNFAGWLISAIAIFTLFRTLDSESRKSHRRSMLYAKGSIEGVGFYLLFGTSTVVSDFQANLPEAAAVSVLLYAISAMILLLTLRGKPAGSTGVQAQH